MISSSSAISILAYAYERGFEGELEDIRGFLLRYSLLLLEEKSQRSISSESHQDSSLTSLHFTSRQRTCGCDDHKTALGPHDVLPAI